MLSKLVVSLYRVLLEIALWVLLIVGFIGGWQADGLLTGILGLISAAIVGAVFFGAFLVIIDIRDRVKAIEERRPPVL
ncbi:MAG: hypothetical protein U5K56_00730 [Halioglobus sp.]|nr:hypothetical protein [Halioglobus sp.]